MNKFWSVLTIALLVPAIAAQRKADGQSGVFNSAPILRPVVLAYCKARRAGDESQIASSFSKATLKEFKRQMRDENVSSFVKFLEHDRVNKICDVGDESIRGRRAIAKFYGDFYPNGFWIVFIKERGNWKFTNRSPTFTEHSP